MESLIITVNIMLSMLNPVDSTNQFVASDRFTRTFLECSLHDKPLRVYSIRGDVKVKSGKSVKGQHVDSYKFKNRRTKRMNTIYATYCQERTVRF